MSSIKDDSKTPLPADFVTDLPEVPQGVDRRAFLMRSAMIGAVAVLSGTVPASAEETAKKAATAATPAGKMSPTLDVVKKSK